MRRLTWCGVVLTLSIVIAHGQEWSSPESGWLYVLDIGDIHGRILLVNPEDGSLKGALPTGYHPNFGMCGDGRRLYVIDGVQPAASLSTFDTRTGQLVQKIPFPDLPTYTVRPSFRGIACSADNKWLFVQRMKMLAPGVDEHSIALVQTATGTILPEAIGLPDCGSATMIAWPFGTWSLVVRCSESRIRLIALDDSGVVTRTRDVSMTWAGQVSPRDQTAALTRAWISPGSLNSRDHSLIICSIGGGLAELDPITFAVTPKVPDTLQWTVPKCGVTSPSGKAFYIGAVPFSQRTNNLMTTLLAFSTETWTKINSAEAPIPFWAFVISSNGKTLYTVNTDANSVTAIDADTLKQVKIFSNLGKNPALILIQP